jgi:hypothetical protein
MVKFNFIKFACLDNEIFLNVTTNSTVSSVLVNDCFLQLILLIPASILFILINSYQFGYCTDLSRHITSKQLNIYRLLSSLLSISVLIKLALNYFVSDISYDASFVVLINDIFQLISTLFHLNLLLNKQIFKNLNFRKYPKSIFISLVIILLANITNFLNQLLRYLYYDQSYNQLFLKNLIINGFYTSILFIYAACIFLFYKIKLQNLISIDNLISEEDKSNYISYLSFNWLQNLMTKGYKQNINSIDDMPHLPQSLNLNSIYKNFMSVYSDYNIDENPIINPEALVNLETLDNSAQLSQIQPIKEKLLKTFIKCYGGEFALIGVFKMINDIVTYCGPLLMNKLIQYIESDQQDLKSGCMYAGSLFLWSIFISFFGVWYNYRLGKLCLKIRAAIMDLIYTKTVQIELSELNNFSIGKIDNLMSIDCETIVNVFPSIHQFWSIPFQIVITFYLLYQQIGLSFLVGIGFVVVVTPINKVLSHYIAKLQEKFLECKDSRVKVR